MQEKIANLRQECVEGLAHAKSVQEIEAIKIKYLGKKSPVQELMRFLKDVEADERPQVGKKINDLKEELTERIDTSMAVMIEKEEAENIAKESIDVTIPGRKKSAGRKHVINQLLDEMIDILREMGFSVQLGPEVESDYYNFEALNLGEDHPARDMQDTFYITEKHLLRTHTSNVQVRVMEANKPPIRIIAPGRAFRNEDISARSHVFFHQIEAVYIDKGVTFADLMSTMQDFLKKFFKRDVEVRFRPSYFPFVEPGMEVDLGCLACNSTGCQLCKYTGWLEVGGAGMIHPEVLKNGGIDPEEYSGFAWGMGVERQLLLKKGIKDIRLFTENDMRFLSQFSGV